MHLLTTLSFTCAAAVLAATGLIGALALEIESLSETLLAAYVIAWAWLIAALVALSPFHAVSATSLWAALIVGLAGASVAWQLVGRPSPSSSPQAFLNYLAASLRDGPVALLAATVPIALAYTFVVGVGVAPNDGDALAYHLPRALFWKQQQSVGWIADVLDTRLDVMPPVGEMGQLATMLVSASDRYVALGPFVAIVASIVGVAHLARRLGFDGRQAMFGALLFATLPVVLLQASSALNDLVVCSFLVCAAALLLSTTNSAIAAGSLATGLAVATKVTAVFGLPWVALLVVATARRGRLLPLAALVGGAVLGSWWYWLNLWHTGHLDGGYAADSGQRPAGLGVVATSVRQLALDLLDLSGVRGRRHRRLLGCCPRTRARGLDRAPARAAREGIARRSSSRRGRARAVRACRASAAARVAGRVERGRSTRVGARAAHHVHAPRAGRRNRVMVRTGAGGVPDRHAPSPSPSAVCAGRMSASWWRARSRRWPRSSCSRASSPTIRTVAAS